MPRLETLDPLPSARPAVVERKILAVGFSADEFNRLAPLLDRASFELDRFPDPTGALDLLGFVPFHMILVRYPLPKMALDDFLSRIRAPHTRSRKSSLVVLATRARVEEARTFLTRGANRVLELEPQAVDLESVVADLLHIAPRRSARFLARLQARLDGAPRSILGVVRNTSATGLLVETEHLLRRGTEVGFELTVPGGKQPIRGRAQVVRHALPDKEHVSGVGMRILSFKGSCDRDYNDYLTRQIH